MRTVRNIVNTGRTIVCTIHQPSIDIFESFDELLLLKRGGQTIYAGHTMHSLLAQAAFHSFCPLCIDVLPQPMVLLASSSSSCVVSKLQLAWMWFVQGTKLIRAVPCCACAVLCCAVLCCAVLCCAVLCRAVPSRCVSSPPE